MAVKIRLRRGGAKGAPTYRLVVADERSKRDGRFIETIGHYNPRRHDAEGQPEVEVNAERAIYWLDRGAQPSDTARSILKKAGVLKLRHDIKHGHGPQPEAEAAPVSEPVAEPAES